MRTSHNNFTGRDVIEIYSDDFGASGKLVNLMQRAGCMHFQLSLTTTQARELADTLTAHAAYLDNLEA